MTKRMVYQVLEQAGDKDRNPVFDVHITHKLIRTFENEGVYIENGRIGFIPHLGIEILKYYDSED